jgi:CrcB protein
MSGLWTVLAVAVGGAVGALIRGAAERYGPMTGLEAWAVILLVNLVGCGLIGYLLIWFECRLRRDGAGLLCVHPRRHRLASIRGLLTPDPTLPAPVVAQAQRRLRIESGLIMTGVLGGLTTFSSFALDVVALIETGQVAAALADVGLSLLGGTLAVFIGMELGLRHFGDSPEQRRA